MAKYFVLDCVAPVGVDSYALLVDASAQKRWKAGVRFSAGDHRRGFHPPTGVIEIRTEPEDSASPRIYGELYWHPIPLMSRRLAAALDAAGIDTLQTYETKLIDPRGSSPPVPDHYLAFNIVGLVAAADLAASKTNPDVDTDKISMDFFSLSLDAAKTRGHLMFRLAENISAVLVHEAVRKSVESAGIDTLTWYEPKNWAG